MPESRFRQSVRAAREDARFARSLKGLPSLVGAFLLRARQHARRSGDTFSLTSATRPEDLAILLELAAGRTNVVELGTGTGWTTTILAMTDPHRQVVSFDPHVRERRENYLALAGPGPARRVRWVKAPGTEASEVEGPVDLLYIDSSHEREPTLAEFRAWAPRLAPDAVVIFDDYTHVDYPGVREAVSELGLSGEQRGTLFVHHVGEASGPPH